MNPAGSRNIRRVLTAIKTANGQRISLERLAEVAGIPMTNTVMKAVDEAERAGLLVVERGRGRVANQYSIPSSVEALL